MGVAGRQEIGGCQIERGRDRVWIGGRACARGGRLCSQGKRCDGCRDKKSADQTPASRLGNDKTPVRDRVHNDQPAMVGRRSHRIGPDAR